MIHFLKTSLNVLSLEKFADARNAKEAHEMVSSKLGLKYFIYGKSFLTFVYILNQLRVKVTIGYRLGHALIKT